MTWFKEALERRTVSPYQLTKAPVLAKLEGALLSGGVRVSERTIENFKLHRKKVVDAGARWDVYQEEKEWDQILLNFHLTISEPDIFRDVPCLFGIHALCKKTRWRKAEVFDYNPEGALVKLVVPRNDVAGEVVVSPFVLHSGSSENGSGPLKGKRLAGGFPVSLLIDPPGERFGTGLELRWYPFPEDQRDSLFYLDLDSETPLLLINKSHSALKHVFEDRSKSGARFKLRNSLFSFIAVDVWMQLAQFAGEITRLHLDDDQDAKVLLSRRVVGSLTRMLKMREDEILQAALDPAERARLHRLLQHHFKLAGHQDALVSTFLEEAPE